MFLKYTKAKIQAVLHCLFHGITLQHIRIFIFQKKKNYYRLFKDVGEQWVEASLSQSPWPWSNDIPRKSLITLILNNLLFKWMGFARKLGTTVKVFIPDSLKKELEKPYPHGIVKKVEGNASTISRSQSWPNSLKVPTSIKQNHGAERFKNRID